MTKGERAIPAEASKGRKTPTFTSNTVPAGLLGTHHTTGWAELVVISGSVAFVEHSPEWHATAASDSPVVIRPNQRHHIDPSTDAEFYVQFYDMPTTQT